MGVEDADSEARFITSWVCKVPPGKMALTGDVEIEGVFQHLEEILSRRRKREPLQLILGRWEFFGRDFFLEPGVLVPRQETEVLLEVSLQRLRVFGEKKLTGLDVGSGSGVICVTLLAEMDNLQMLAVDVAEKAVQVTEKNARHYGLSNRLRIYRGDFRVTAGWENMVFDFIVANPPYLSKEELMTAMPEVRDHEPQEALVGGETGTEHIEDLVRFSGDRLVPGGFLFFEFGYDQKERVVEIIEGDGRFEKCEIIRDLARIPRVAIARKRRTAGGETG
ncbi:MAG: peptide chain release factor N(5)-glutamine methyltransferase [Deltaproteobacteria bacterium]|nr:peptide chain release factor N(5)-glutamine methyltransferase [Deltaproteobacteria bacterium]